MDPKRRSNNFSGGYRNQSENRKVLSVVYPIFVYFLVCQIVNMLVGLFPMAAQIDAVKRQGMGSLAALLVLYFCCIRSTCIRSSGSRHTDGGVIAWLCRHRDE